MALRLTLKPNERVLVGSAVLKNGRQRTELFVENHVPVLRGQDILSPAAVKTPCERVVLAIQLMYVEPLRREAHRESYRSLVSDVLSAGPSSRRLIEAVDQHVERGEFYQAIKQARALLAWEREVLPDVS
jgi:flagellar protein FlbT